MPTQIDAAVAPPFDFPASDHVNDRAAGVANTAVRNTGCDSNFSNPA